jgi:hypothetical protein
MVKRARESLFERAAGYTFESEKVFQFQGRIIRAKTVEHIPPDPTAALKILERLDPGTWRERTVGRGVLRPSSPIGAPGHGPASLRVFLEHLSRVERIVGGGIASAKHDDGHAKMVERQHIDRRKPEGTVAIP